MDFSSRFRRLPISADDFGGDDDNGTEGGGGGGSDNDSTATMSDSNNANLTKIIVIHGRISLGSERRIDFSLLKVMLYNLRFKTIFESPEVVQTNNFIYVIFFNLFFAVKVKLLRGKLCRDEKNWFS